MASRRLSFDDIASLLKGLGGKIHYVPNTGNAGDSLIAEATYQFLEEHGIDYSVGRLDERLSEKRIVVVGGGGNFNGQYGNVRNFLNANFDRFERLVILPHTIRGEPELLGRMDDRFTLICREFPSYEHCAAVASNANVYLSDDMALAWNVDKTLAYVRSLKAHDRVDRAFLYRQAKHEFRLLQYRACKKTGSLNAFRKDIESSGSALPPNNADLSDIFATDNMTRRFAASAVSFLVRYLASVKEVHSDRLHVSIIAAMLGKTVFMHDNNYGKNSSVYENSLEHRFANIAFVGRPERQVAA